MINLILKTLVFTSIVKGMLKPDIPDPDAHGEPLIDLHVKRGGNAPERIIRAGPASLLVEFAAFDNEYTLDLQLNEHLFHADVPAEQQRHWSYRGNSTLNGWLRGTASLTFHEDDYRSAFQGTMKVDDTTYRFHSGKFYDNLRDHGHKMGVHRFGPGVGNDVSQPRGFAGKLEHHPEAKRRNLQVDYWNNCFPNQGTYVKKVGMGYIADRAFFNRILEYMKYESGSDNEKLIRYITQVNQDINDVYHAQFDIYIHIAELIYPPYSIDIHSNLENCPSEATGGDRARRTLTEVMDWRRTQRPASQGVGMYMVVTNCGYDGIVGYGSLNVCCTDSGVAWSAFATEAGTGTWQTVAHEAGHLIGGEHTFRSGGLGGIMDYGSGFLENTGVKQFDPANKDQICAYMSGKMVSTPGCFETLGRNDGVTYTWRQSKDMMECWPARGAYRFRTTVFECESYGANGARSVSPTYSCDLTTRPYGEITQCSGVGYGASCGNGIIEEGEECERARDGNCCNNCRWDTSASGCSNSDVNVDAAFMTPGRVLYLFRNGQVYRFTGGQESGLDSGYPKAIRTEWPNVDSGIADDVTAAMLEEPNLMWIISGLDYQIINIDTGADTKGEVKSFYKSWMTKYDHGESTVWNDDVTNQHIASESVNLFMNCGKITAAVGFSDNYYLFCESFYGVFLWGLKDRSMLSIRSVQELELGFNWNQIYRHLDAAYYDQGQRKVRFFDAGYHVDWWGTEVILSQTKTKSLVTGGYTPPTGGGGNPSPTPQPTPLPTPTPTAANGPPTPRPTNGGSPSDYYQISQGTKCPTTDRAFKMGLMSLDDCAERCFNDAACSFFSASTDDCIGCNIRPEESDGDFNSYAFRASSPTEPPTSRTTISPTNPRDPTPTAQPTTNLPAGQSNQCMTHCIRCYRDDPQFCLECESGFHLWGSRCIGNNYGFVMNWDTHEGSKDYLLLRDGESQMNQYITQLKILPSSHNGNSFHIEPTDKVDFIPIDQEFQPFSFQMQFKPDANHTYTDDARVVTFMGTNDEKIKVDMKPPANDSVQIVAYFDHGEMLCETNDPISLGEWNTFEFKFDPTSWKCCTNGRCMERSYSLYNGSAFNASFYMDDWSVGHASRGLKGEIDSIALTIGALPSSGAEGDAGFPAGAIAALVLIPLLCCCMGAFGYWYFYHKDPSDDLCEFPDCSETGERCSACCACPDFSQMWPGTPKDEPVVTSPQISSPVAQARPYPDPYAATSMQQPQPIVQSTRPPAPPKKQSMPVARPPPPFAHAASMPGRRPPQHPQLAHHAFSQPGARSPPPKRESGRPKVLDRWNPHANNEPGGAPRPPPKRQVGKLDMKRFSALSGGDTFPPENPNVKRASSSYQFSGAGPVPQGRLPPPPRRT